MSDPVNKFDVLSGEAYTTVLGKKIYSVMDYDETGMWTKPVIKIPAYQLTLEQLRVFLEGLETASKQSTMLALVLMGKSANKEDAGA